MFDKPTPPSGGGDVINQADYVGQLLVVTVHEHITGMVTTSTKPGETTEAARSDVYVISPDGTVTAEFHDTLLFGKVLVGQLKRSVGRTVVGILGLGEKRNGNNAPYVLNEAPSAAEEAAVRAMTSKPQAAQQAAPQAQPQAQAPAAAWGQQAPAQQPQAAPAAPWGGQPAAAVPAAPWA